MIRKYFPKGTDFTNVTQEELNKVAYEINNSYRQLLGGKSSTEEYVRITGAALPEFVC
jgi:IS30 family transposase